ncbi:MAG: transcriptional repressor [Verrucomicrobiota bacterium]
MTAPSQPDLTEDFVGAAKLYWENQGARLTFVRRTLCEVIAKQTVAFDAEGLLESAQKVDPAISLSSVYRTVKSLVEGGLLTTIDGRNGERLFERPDPGQSSTSHIVCRDCGAVVQLEDPCIPVREMPTISAKGFVPDKFALRIEANCNEMAQTGSCSKCEPEAAE